MKEYSFRKDESTLYATSNGWTDAFTPSGDVDTGLEHNLGEKITQDEAEKILNKYGWYICSKCGSIQVDGEDCRECQLVEHDKEL